MNSVKSIFHSRDKGDSEEKQDHILTTRDALGPRGEKKKKNSETLVAEDVLCFFLVLVVFSNHEHIL